MKLVTQRAVDMALRTMSDAERKKVLGWFDQLKNWNNDAKVRKNSFKLEAFEDLYMLKTRGELRIFFRLGADEVTIIDIASRSTILALGGKSE